MTKPEFPCKGKIKTSGAIVTVYAATRVAGIKTYRVSFDGRTTVEWARSKVVLLGG